MLIARKMLLGLMVAGMMAGTVQAGDGWSLNLGFGRKKHRDPVRRVWVPPVYEDREVCTEVPAVVVSREVPIYRRGCVVGYRTVREVVEPAYTWCRVERVVVREGYYRSVDPRHRSARFVDVGLNAGGLYLGVAVGHNRTYDRHHGRHSPRRYRHHR